MQTQQAWRTNSITEVTSPVTSVVHETRRKPLFTECYTQALRSIVKQVSVARCFLVIVLVAAIAILYFRFQFFINTNTTALGDEKLATDFNTSEPIGRIWVNLTLPSWEELKEKYRSDRFMISRYGVIPIDEFNRTHAKVSSNYHLPMFSNENQALWYPKYQKPTTKIAIIIPYRNRESHLRIWLNNMPAFLCKQNLHFAIIIVEQTGNDTFNKAALYNVGFLESNLLDNFDCFVFHDVDMIPEDDRLPYRCGDDPIHFVVALSRVNYRLYYDTFVGGALAMTRSQFTKVRGFSNMFFGWGGEDDDMYERIIHANYTLRRHPAEISRFMTIQHERDETNQENPLRFKLLEQAARRFETDGYPETKYEVEYFGPKHDGLVYWLSVDVNKHQGQPNL